MNTSETDHALRSPVFQTIPSGIAKLTDPIKVPGAQLSTDRSRSTLPSPPTLNIRSTKRPDSLNVHGHSRSFTIIHNKNSERSGGVTKRLCLRRKLLMKNETQK